MCGGCVAGAGRRGRALAGTPRRAAPCTQAASHLFPACCLVCAARQGLPSHKAFTSGTRGCLRPAHPCLAAPPATPPSAGEGRGAEVPQRAHAPPGLPPQAGAPRWPTPCSAWCSGSACSACPGPTGLSRSRRHASSKWTCSTPRPRSAPQAARPALAAQPPTPPLPPAARWRVRPLRPLRHLPSLWARLPRREALMQQRQPRRRRRRRLLRGVAAAWRHGPASQSCCKGRSRCRARCVPGLTRR